MSADKLPPIDGTRIAYESPGHHHRLGDEVWDMRVYGIGEAIDRQFSFTVALDVGDSIKTLTTEQAIRLRFYLGLAINDVFAARAAATGEPNP